MLSSIRRVGESLCASKLLCKLAREWLVPSVGAHVDLAVLQTGKGTFAAFKLKKDVEFA